MQKLKKMNLKTNCSFVVQIKEISKVNWFQAWSTGKVIIAWVLEEGSAWTPLSWEKQARQDVQMCAGVDSGDKWLSVPVQMWSPKRKGNTRSNSLLPAAKSLFLLTTMSTFLPSPKCWQPCSQKQKVAPLLSPLSNISLHSRAEALPPTMA